jgi:hypothetical protein
MATVAALVVFPSSLSGQVRYQPLVPGTGHEVAGVGDDFEDVTWSYTPNLPKVYNNKDHAVADNFPLGESANARWHEGIKRGQPDVVRRVAPPENGLPGSTGAMLLQSLQTGSSQPGFQQQQDDFIANVVAAIGETPVSQSPSVVTRVWLPPIEEWENRTGCHFAFRISLETDNYARPVRRFGRPAENEFDGTYWPGIFINMNSREGRGGTGRENDELYFWMKASDNGQVIRGPQITSTGWWTLGMSVTPDGRVHYFAKAGVEDLTIEDHIASALPFGYRANRFRTFFFNVCNGDDGKTWSTHFVVDDTRMFVVGKESAGVAGYRK